MILNDCYTTPSAAKYLGVSPLTVRTFTGLGRLTPFRVGAANVYEKSDLDAVKAKYFADGLSHTDIAEKYGVKRTLVIYYYKKLGVKPSGKDGRRKGAPAVYDPSTVEKFAKIIGWDPPQSQNQTCVP
jgi:hypothetical protein